MSDQIKNNIWHISIPETLPKAPNWMSFSTLTDLESCPKRWVLSTADYPHLWNHRGYPRTPNISALEGTIIHLALKKISQELMKDKCYSLLDKCAISVLKGLGGYSNIIETCIEQALRSYEQNPRAAHILDRIRNQLIPQVPKFRIRTQQLLSRIHLAPYDNVPLIIDRSLQTSRFPLPLGSNAEVELQFSELGWHGFADLIILTPDICEIRDFKTGVPKPQHEFQLRMYALLWARDRILNPSGRLANKLILSYDKNDLEILPPNEGELRLLEEDIISRTAKALIDIQINPPIARLSEENCAYCAVRQLCEEYWQCLALQGNEELFSEGQVTDLQLKLIARHSPSSWDGIVESSNIISVDRSILLRTSNLPFELCRGQKIRMLNIRANKYKDEYAEVKPTCFIATMNIWTEAFLVPSATILI